VRERGRTNEIIQTNEKMGICGSSPESNSTKEGSTSNDDDDEEEGRPSFDLESLRHNSSYANLIPLQRDTKVAGKATLHVQSNTRYVLTHSQRLTETYEITEHILGQGLTGRVVAITHKKTGARRALKNIDLSKVNPKYVERLRGEIEILKQLDHPNVVKLYETYEYDGQIYMVLELCHGGELYQRLKDRKEFTESETRSYVSQMLGALSYCHSKGIAHRDVKLANFVFKNRTPDAPLKLIDFGFSATMTTNSTTFSTFVGSAYYMAPEVVSKEQYTLQCDMWGVGVVTYTLLAGHPPFMGKTEEEISKNIRTKKPQFRGKKWKSVSAKCKHFILRLLEKKAKKRLTSERAMRDSWIREQKIKKLDLKDEDVLALKRFSKYSRLKQIGLVVMAHFADRDMVQNVVNTFASVDEDSSGRIDEQELVDELKRYDIDEKEAKMIFHSIDQDSSGSIRFSEFLAPMLEDHVSTKSACREVFNLMDSEKRGYITREYFRKILVGLVSNEMIEKIMEEADSDGDGKIDFEEFTKTMLCDRKDRESSPRLTSLCRKSTNPLLNRPRSSSLVAVHYTRSVSGELKEIEEDDVVLKVDAAASTKMEDPTPLVLGDRTVDSNSSSSSSSSSPPVPPPSS